MARGRAKQQDGPESTWSFRVRDGRVRPAGSDRGRDHGVLAIRVRARAGPGLKGGDVDEVVKAVRRDQRVQAQMKGT